MKCLVWDQTGPVLIYKKLEGGAFHWRKPADGMTRLSPAQFSALVEGLNWKAVRAERRRRPRLADRRGRVTLGVLSESIAAGCGVSSLHGIEQDQCGPRGKS